MYVLLYAPMRTVLCYKSWQTHGCVHSGRPILRTEASKRNCEEATMTPERTIDYLLIGGGLASATAAEAIRKRDPNGSILIVGNDPHNPYNRPPLSKEYL